MYGEIKNLATYGRNGSSQMTQKKRRNKKILKLMQYYKRFVYNLRESAQSAEEMEVRR